MLFESVQSIRLPKCYRRPKKKVFILMFSLDTIRCLLLNASIVFGELQIHQHPKLQLASPRLSAADFGKFQLLSVLENLGWLKLARMISAKTAHGVARPPLAGSPAEKSFSWFVGRPSCRSLSTFAQRCAIECRKARQNYLTHYGELMLATFHLFSNFFLPRKSIL